MIELDNKIRTIVEQWFQANNWVATERAVVPALETAKQAYLRKESEFRHKWPDEDELFNHLEEYMSSLPADLDKAQRLRIKQAFVYCAESLRERMLEPKYE